MLVVWQNSIPSNSKIIQRSILYTPSPVRPTVWDYPDHEPDVCMKLFDVFIMMIVNSTECQLWYLTTLLQGPQGYRSTTPGLAKIRKKGEGGSDKVPSLIT